MLLRLFNLENLILHSITCSQSLEGNQCQIFIRRCFLFVCIFYILPAPTLWAFMPISSWWLEMMTHNVSDGCLIQRDIFFVLGSFQLTSQMKANSTAFDQEIWKIYDCDAADWRRLSIRSCGGRPPDLTGYVTVCVVMALLYYCSKCWRLLSWLLSELYDALGYNCKIKSVFVLTKWYRVTCCCLQEYRLLLSNE